MNDFLYPEEREKLYDDYETAHEIAKKFLNENPNTDSSAVYAAADLAVKIYNANETIRQSTALNHFVRFKINSAVKKRSKKRMEENNNAKFTPLSDDIKEAVIAEKTTGASNETIAKKCGISASSVSRILKKANAAATATPVQETKDMSGSENSIDGILGTVITLIKSGVNDVSFSVNLDGSKYLFSVVKEK